MSKPLGRYETQMGAYQAFLPDPLPPAGLNVGPRLQPMPSKADRACASRFLAAVGAVVERGACGAHAVMGPTIGKREEVRGSLRVRV